MSLDTTNLLNTVAAMGLAGLKRNLVMARMSNREYEKEIAGATKNATVNIIVPAEQSATDVTPGYLPTAPDSPAPTKVAITLDQWKEATFGMDDKAIMQVNKGIVPMQLTEASKALALAIDTNLWLNYKKFGGYAGTAATTPFATDLTAFLAADKVANDRLMPGDDRYMVINTAARSQALNLRALQDASYKGDPKAMIKGEIGETLGARWMWTTQVPSHTAGTITTGLIAKASTPVAVGAVSFVGTTAASTGACALLTGDVIAIAGHTKTYALAAAATQASAATDVTITITEGLEIALVGSEAITVKATHRVNLLIQQNAIAFAMAPLVEANLFPDHSLQAYAIDELSGLSLRLEVTRQHKQWKWAFDALWGSAVPRPQFGVRLAG